MTMSTGIAKAAILLKSLGTETAEQVLTRLGPEYGSRLRGEIQRLEQTPPAQDLLEEVRQEFQQLLRTVEATPGKPAAHASQDSSVEDAAQTGAPPPALRLVSPPAPEP